MKFISNVYILIAIFRLVSKETESVSEKTKSRIVRFMKRQKDWNIREKMKVLIKYL